MKASRFAESVALVGCAVGGLIAVNTHGTAWYLGTALSVGSVVWYFRRGQNLSGWVGRSPEEMAQELKALSRQLEAVGRLEDSPDKFRKEIDLHQRQDAVEKELADYQAAAPR